MATIATCPLAMSSSSVTSRWGLKVLDMVRGPPKAGGPLYSMRRASTSVALTGAAAAFLVKVMAEIILAHRFIFSADSMAANCFGVNDAFCCCSINLRLASWKKNSWLTLGLRNWTFWCRFLLAGVTCHGWDPSAGTDDLIKKKKQTNKRNLCYYKWNWFPWQRPPPPATQSSWVTSRRL